MAQNLDFNKGYTCSVFETTIRVMGGLLSAYDLSGDAMFLEKARQLADRLLPAWKTPSGIPWHYLKLDTGTGDSPGWTGVCVHIDCCLSNPWYTPCVSMHCYLSTPVLLHPSLPECALGTPGEAELALHLTGVSERHLWYTPDDSGLIAGKGHGSALMQGTNVF